MGVVDVVDVEFFLTELEVSAVEPVAGIGMSVPRLARQGVVDVAGVAVLAERQLLAHQRRTRRPVRFSLQLRSKFIQSKKKTNKSLAELLHLLIC